MVFSRQERALRGEGMNQNVLVWREEKAYRWLLLSGLVSGMGDWFNIVSLTQLVTTLTHSNESGVAISILTAVKAAPYLFFGALGGVVADRFHKKHIMIICDLISALLALSFLFITSADRVWVAYAGSLGLVLSSIFNAPARSASIRRLVRTEHILPAVALNQQVQGSVLMLGSVLGGVVSAAWGVETAFLVNAVSFLGSALLVMKVKYPQVATARAERSEQVTKQQPKASLREVLPFLKKSRYLQLSTLYLVLWAIGGGLMNVVPAIVNRDVFQGGAFGLGVINGAFGVGMICGGLLAPACKRYMRSALVFGYMAEGVAYLLFGVTSRLWVGAFAFAFALCGVAVANTCNRSLQVIEIPPDMQGRVFALISSAVNTTLTVSMLAAGQLLRVLSGQTVSLIAGVLIIGGSVIFGLLLLRVELPKIDEKSALPT